MDYLLRIWEVLAGWVWLPVLVVYVGLIATILVENRDPEKTIAWILVIVFLPVIGVITYYIFGQKYNKEKYLKHISRQEHARLVAVWDRLEPLIEDNLKEIEQKIGPLGNVFSFLYQERIAPVTLRNRADLLVNGEEKFPELFRCIRTARHHIHLEYYIFEPDELGTRLLALLGEKAAAGVQVRLLVDDFGSPAMKRQAGTLRKEGVELVRFLPVNFTSLADSNYRNHRKVAIIDGEIAFVGGMNISRRYVNKSSQEVRWRDTSVKITGSAVNVLQAWFWMGWLFAGGTRFSLSDGYLSSADTAYGNAAIAFAYSDPGSKAPYNMEAMLLAISQARHTLRLCTPYFIPSDQLMTALQLAASSGVRVELMLPARSDSYIVQHASLSYLKPLLERGIHVYLYQHGFMHAKTVCVDGKLAFIGTVNLDTRSFYINFEVSAVIQDEGLCRQLDEQFDVDLKQSRLLTLDDWTNRPSLHRGLDSLCRLLAPLL